MEIGSKGSVVVVYVIESTPATERELRVQEQHRGATTLTAIAVSLVLPLGTLSPCRAC